MLLPLLLFICPLALAPPQVATGAPGSTRTPVFADTPLLLNPLARARAIYAKHAKQSQPTGADLIVLDPKGEPLERATVVVITNVLEVAQTDATGLAQLEHRSEATGIYIWSPGLPVAHLDGDPLEFHRSQAGAGSMLVGLRASTTLEWNDRKLFRQPGASEPPFDLGDPVAVTISAGKTAHIELR